MHRVLVASAPGFFGRLANVRFLVARRKPRATEESPTRVEHDAATIGDRAEQRSRGASIIAADLDRHAESLDAVSGSEFVDDRIRLRE